MSINQNTIALTVVVLLVIAGSAFLAYRRRKK
ncbi:LPXTG cell wall anchor domain-containing protein [Patescibacteria group bacterium]|nr:LPXTG cell wall anchor domain-containing protein [Patescibacteria group bacterium]